MLTISVLGIVISSYLVYLDFVLKAGGQSGCNINQYINCDDVLKSTYADFFGIPIGAFGLLWFLGVIALVFPEKLKLPKMIADNSKFLLVLWCIAGLSPVLFLIFVEVSILHKICIFCTTDHVLIFLTFILAIENFRKN